MSIETDIVIFIVKSFAFEWWWLDNKEVLVVMVRRFSGVPHSYIDKVVYACALSGYLLTLKHISDKRKVMKEKANGLPCLFKIQSKCASFLSNETTESKKNTLASYKVLLFGNITLMRVSCSIVFSKWKISILFIKWEFTSKTRFPGALCCLSLILRSFEFIILSAILKY